MPARGPTATPQPGYTSGIESTLDWLQGVRGSGRLVDIPGVVNVPARTPAGGGAVLQGSPISGASRGITGPRQGSGIGMVSPSQFDRHYRTYQDIQRMRSAGGASGGVAAPQESTGIGGMIPRRRPEASQQPMSPERVAEETSIGPSPIKPGPERAMAKDQGLFSENTENILMDLGLALMNNNSPDFLSALGSAGQVAVDRDIAREQRKQAGELEQAKLDVQREGVQVEREAIKSRENISRSELEFQKANAAEVNKINKLRLEVDKQQANSYATQAEASMLSAVAGIKDTFISSDGTMYLVPKVGDPIRAIDPETGEVIKGQTADEKALLSSTARVIAENESWDGVDGESIGRTIKKILEGYRGKGAAPSPSGGASRIVSPEELQ